MTDSKVARYQLGVTFAGLVSVIIFMVTLAYAGGGAMNTVNTSAESIKTLAAIVETIKQDAIAHNAEFGHPVMMQRVDGIEADITEIKGTVLHNSDTLKRIESKIGGGND
jgi:hypothetical protein